MSSPDTAAAAKIIAANAHKPIRRMLPTDYSAAKIVPDTRKLVRDRKSAQADLTTKCEALLRQRGPLTTTQLTIAVGIDYKRVCLACRLIDGIQSREIKIRRGSKSIEWSLSGSEQLTEMK